MISGFGAAAGTLKQRAFTKLRSTHDFLQKHAHFFPDTRVFGRVNSVIFYF